MRTSLLATEHEGVTGRIVLDPITQDRLADIALYQVCVRELGTLAPVSPASTLGSTSFIASC